MLAVLGGAAPVAWVIVARTGAVLAVLLAFLLGRDLGGVAAGVVAAAGWRAATCGYARPEPRAGRSRWRWPASLAWRADRPRAALACAVGCALLRVEAWPFLLAVGPCCGGGGRRTARWCVAGARRACPPRGSCPSGSAPATCCAPASRARMPNPGQPATEAVPALAALSEAGVAAAVAAVDRRPLRAAGRAAAARAPAWRGSRSSRVMAQAGFSGEPRYALPGAALVAIAGAAGLVAVARDRRARWLAAVALLAAAAPKLADLPDLRRDQAYQRRLAADLRRAITGAGGRDALLGCGRPYVGDLRGPLLAYHLDVEKRRVAFVPRPPARCSARASLPALPSSPWWAPRSRDVRGRGAGRSSPHVRVP